LYSTQFQPGDGELSYSDLDEFTSQYDGVTTWTARAAEGWGTNANQEETLEWVEENWTSAREYTDANDMDLIPMVHPGFDDRGNSCWGGDRYTPRGPEYFERLLSLADEYRTTEKVYIATWNAWTEGTQIEPGSFRGTDYGTEYVEIVQEFQNMN
jgi:hypothetical protein